MPTQTAERSESAPVSILNALCEERQSLIDKQRSIDASLDLIRSGRLNLPNAPRREVSLDLGGNTFQRHAAARREEDIRLAQYASFPQADASGVHQETAQALTNLRKNRDDLLDESESNIHTDALSALQQAYQANPALAAVGNGDPEDLLTRLRNSQMVNRELLGVRLGGFPHQGGGDNSNNNLPFMLSQEQQRMVERMAMEARMPDALARSRTLDPALLLQRHRNAGHGGSGQPQHRMF